MKPKHSKKNVDKLLRAMSENKKTVDKVVAQNHLAVEILYAQAKERLSGKEKLDAETHLDVCKECQEVVAEFKKMMETIEAYEPEEAKKRIPEKVLQAIPQPQSARGAYAQLRFNANQVLEKVQGVVKSMGGVLESLADFTVEALTPDTEFLAQTRGELPAITDYRTLYKDMDITFSTLAEQNTLEVYISIKDKSSAALKDMNFRLKGEEEGVHKPESQAILKDSIKLVFSNLNLSDKSYEFLISSEPVSD